MFLEKLWKSELGSGLREGWAHLQECASIQRSLAPVRELLEMPGCKRIIVPISNIGWNTASGYVDGRLIAAVVVIAIPVLTLIGLDIMNCSATPEVILLYKQSLDIGSRVALFCEAVGPIYGFCKGIFAVYSQSRHLTQHELSSTVLPV